MRYLLAIALLAMCSCTTREVTRRTYDGLNLQQECKITEQGMLNAAFCKYTNKNGDTVCAKVGDAGFTVPCDFYEGL